MALFPRDLYAIGYAGNALAFHMFLRYNSIVAYWLPAIQAGEEKCQRFTST